MSRTATAITIICAVVLVGLLMWATPAPAAAACPPGDPRAECQCVENNWVNRLWSSGNICPDHNPGTAETTDPTDPQEPGTPGGNPGAGNPGNGKSVGNAGEKGMDNESDKSGTRGRGNDPDKGRNK
jgi:hypothetical protein